MKALVYLGPRRMELQDLPEPSPARQDDGSWIVPARWRIDEVTDATGVDLPEGAGYDTISGLVMSHLGRVPQVGDAFSLDSGAALAVLTVDRHVPGSVRLSAPVGSEVAG